MAAPSVGSSCMLPTRRRISSRSSGSDDFAVSRIGLIASVSCCLSCPVVPSKRNARPPTISIISYERKQSVVMLDFMCMLISRSVFANSARALRVVDSNAEAHASRLKMADMFENSARNMPSMPLA